MVLWVATLRDRVGGRDGGGLASRRRERKAQTGLMLLGDGSRHDWLAGPGWRWWGALDDATSRRRGGRPHYAIGMPPDARLEPDLDRDTARDGDTRRHPPASAQARRARRPLGATLVVHLATCGPAPGPSVPGLPL